MSAYTRLRITKIDIKDLDIGFALLAIYISTDEFPKHRNKLKLKRNILTYHHVQKEEGTKFFLVKFVQLSQSHLTESDNE